MVGPHMGWTKNKYPKVNLNASNVAQNPWYTSALVHFSTTSFPTYDLDSGQFTCQIAAIQSLRCTDDDDEAEVEEEGDAALLRPPVSTMEFQEGTSCTIASTP